MTEQTLDDRITILIMRWQQENRAYFHEFPPPLVRRDLHLRIAALVETEVAALTRTEVAAVLDSSRPVSKVSSRGKRGRANNGKVAGSGG